MSGVNAHSMAFTQFKLAGLFYDVAEAREWLYLSHQFRPRLIVCVVRLEDSRNIQLAVFMYRHDDACRNCAMPSIIAHASRARIHKVFKPFDLLRSFDARIEARVNDANLDCFVCTSSRGGKLHDSL